MDICEYCFDSQCISEYVIEKGNKLSKNTSCSNCKNGSIYRLDKFLLKNKVQSIIREVYSHEFDHGLVGSAGMYAKEEGDSIEDFLPNLKSLKDVCWELFDLDTINDDFYNLLKDYETDGISEFDDDPDNEVWLNIGCHWDGSDYIPLEWDKFCNNVKHSARFFDHDGYNRTLELKKLDNTFKSLSADFTKTLFRARNANQTKHFKAIETNPEKELGIAPTSCAKHNRFSPVGISYVYLSSDKGTILKEIRAKGGDTVGIGTFEIENLKLIDLRKETLATAKFNPFSIHFSSEIRCSYDVLIAFLYDISKPVKDSDSHLDYIPTQIVSEYIWSLGYDGFIFDSSLCDGDNYVLFKDSYKYIEYEIIDL